MKQPQWAAVEMGRFTPTLETLGSVAGALDCRVQDLI